MKITVIDDQTRDWELSEDTESPVGFAFAIFKMTLGWNFVIVL